MLAVVAAWLLFIGARDASLVEWECAVATCGTNDPRGVAPMIGVLALALAGTLLGRTLRTASAPLMVVAGAAGALLGWRSALDQGLVHVESIRWWLIAAGLVLSVALVLTVLTSVRELRRSSAYWVLLGLRSAWGRVTDYQNGDGGRCTGTVHFADEAGNRHQVRMEVPRDAFARPPRVYYDPVAPTDLGRLRIGLPGRPLTAKARAEQLAAVKQMLPLPGDIAQEHATMQVAADGTRTTTSTGADGTRTTVVTPDGVRTTTIVGPDGTRTVRSTSSASSGAATETATDVTTALERLSALHASGALTEDEFQAAKAAVLRQ
ncbi:SHOCT domain-containing protein [Cellulomonas sp. NPDC089187]|uniref:SHOCT domain-containing protein n=1 Tax=Cellulomonas sp. NPDC089187 TaxID=3154970 RepID=UPI003427A6EA